MALILETERLTIREFETGDAAFLLQLVNTETWIRFIGDRNIHTLAAAEQYLLDGPLASYKTNGYGLWLVALKNSPVSAGMCGIVKRNTLGHPDIGFAFLPEYGQKGYGSESAAAVLDYAFQNLELPKILAITLPDNVASIGLLHKIGMALEEEILWPDTKEILLQFSAIKKE